MAIVAQLGPATPYWLLAAGLLMLGAGMGALGGVTNPTRINSG